MPNAQPQRAARRRGDSAAYAFDQLVFDNSQWRESVVAEELYSQPKNPTAGMFDTRGSMIFGRYLRTVREGTFGQLDNNTTLAQVNQDRAFL